MSIWVESVVLPSVKEITIKNIKLKFSICRVITSRNNVWLTAIPRDNIRDKRDTSVCEKHWHKGYAIILVHGKECPMDLPSIFEGVPLSMIPTLSPKPRQTTSTSLEIRGKQDDELDAFLKMDNVTLEYLSANIFTHQFLCSVICYSIENTLNVQSTSLFAESLPMFLVKMSEDLKFQPYHTGVRCYIPSLSKNHITTLNSWSKLEETIRFLHTLQSKTKKQF